MLKMRSSVGAFAAVFLLFVSCSHESSRTKEVRELEGPTSPRVIEKRKELLAEEGLRLVDPNGTSSCPGAIQNRCDLPGFGSRGVLCENFDTERNGEAGYQWSRNPRWTVINTELANIVLSAGDPGDDVLGFTVGSGPASSFGTEGQLCANSFAFEPGPTCAAPVEMANDWHLHSPTEGPGAGYDDGRPTAIGAPDGGKAHSGMRSMHMGRHTDPASTLGDTIRFRQVSAYVMDVLWQWREVAGIVPGPESRLEFWHMISMPDGENFGLSLTRDETLGGGQVQISARLSEVGPYGEWETLTPTFNGYDSFQQRTVVVCQFDPGDDQAGSGNETMCDSPLWADMGDIIGTDSSCAEDTDGNDLAHRDCGAISSCSGGPGCAENGSIGTGVWVRAEFDLSEYEGRYIRLRWIGTVGGGWIFGRDRSFLEPVPGGEPYQMYEADDGWWIDDIVLTDLRPYSYDPENCPD